MHFPLPELGSWLKQRFFSDRGETLSLGLKGLSWDQAQASWYQFNGYRQLATLVMAGVPASSGEVVSRQAALQHPVVFACNRIISESIGFIPARLMQRQNGVKHQAVDHPLYSLMINAPNEEITAQGFTELLTSHCLLEGGGFAKIVRRSSMVGSGTNRRQEGGPAIALEALLPEQVQVDREKTGQKRLVYKILNEAGSVDRTYTVETGKPHDILHLRGMGWDGLRGYSLIALAREAIGTAIAQERNLALFYQMGGRLPYHIELTKPFGKTADAQKWREDWANIMRRPHEPPMTEPGMSYKPDGLSMIDAQMVELRRSSVEAICRFCNVTPPLVHELSRATFANIEQLFLYFEKLTLSPWLSRWEQDVWRCVLTPAEKSQGYFLRHDAKELLRGDFLTRMKGYSMALQNGWRSINEVRADEDFDGIGPEGDRYHIQLNMQDLDESLASDYAYGSTPATADDTQDTAKPQTPKKPKKAQPPLQIVVKAEDEALLQSVREPLSSRWPLTDGMQGDAESVTVTIPAPKVGEIVAEALAKQGAQIEQALAEQNRVLETHSESIVASLREANRPRKVKKIVVRDAEGNISSVTEEPIH